MNNSEVLRALDECEADLLAVKAIVDSLGYASNIVPYLSKYAIIRACGTIETAFKGIIADHCSKRAKQQVKTFIGRKVRESSTNPSYDNICRVLGDFDPDWKEAFKQQIKIHPDKSILLTSIQSLVDARNDFAHGGNPGLTISDTVNYFGHCRTVLIVLDDIVS